MPMKIATLGFLAGALCFSSVQLELFGEASAQTPSPDEKTKLRLEILSKDPAAAWASSVAPLVDQNLVPVGKLFLKKGQDPCGAVLERLGFTELGLGCATEMEQLLEKMNPNQPAVAQVNQEVKFPDLPVYTFKWSVGFDSDVPAERDRYLKIKNNWQKFETKQFSSGSLRQLQFKGIASDFDARTGTATNIASSVTKFNSDLDRYETRIVPLAEEKGSHKDEKTRFSSSGPPITPVDWVDLCNKNKIPAQPLPSYIFQLNSSSPPACISKCKAGGGSNCPQVILIDQEVAAHPDLAAALGNPAPKTAVNWCPLIAFDQTKDHGTHMAGIIAASGKWGGFAGVAPNTQLVSKHIKDEEIAALINDGFYNPQPMIYVYASKFNPQTLLGGTDRLHQPSYVEDILGSRGLWVVAAGQQDKNQPIGKEITSTSTDSPMNLGDRRNVLVVTSCDDCYTKGEHIPAWANYGSPTSGGLGYELVNVAAPGGDVGGELPSTTGVSGYGATYGTSQATALVAGLAAAMAACFPSRYVDPWFLKQRILTTSKTPSEDDDAKISAGVVDASLALLDPDLHWVAVRGDPYRSAQEAWFCTERLTIKDGNDEEVGISTKFIRRISQQKGSDGISRFNLLYERQPAARKPEVFPRVIAKISGTLVDDGRKPFVYFRGVEAGLSQKPISIDGIDDLVVSLQSGKIPPALKGCQ